MKAIIIAGGLGTRLRPLTYNTPKSIVPVANRPFVLHQIELLKKYGITEIILNLHYLSESIKKLFEDEKKLGIKVHYSIEERPLGTAGAVKNAEKFFEAGPMLIFNGDILTDMNLKEIMDFHLEKKARVTLALTRVEDPTTYGLVITDKDGRVERFIEKPSWEAVTANTINAGVYVLDSEIFKDVPARVELSFERELYPSLLKKKEPIYGFVTDAFWIDIGSLAKYMFAHRAILEGDIAVNIPGKKGDFKIFMGDHAQVAETAKIHSPAIIGNDCILKENSRVYSFSVLGDRVRVGKGSVIERAVIWEGTEIGDEVNLTDCIIGFNCKIEDGASLSGGIVLADKTIVKKGSKLGVKL